LTSFYVKACVTDFIFKLGSYVKKSKVSIIHCDSYHPDAVSEAVERGIDLIGGVQSYIGDGESVLLKPNLLFGKPPEKAVTTHPAVFQAAASVMAAAGHKISFGDSPGFQTPKGAAAKAGLLEVSEQMDIKLADFTSGQEKNIVIDDEEYHLPISNGVLSADAMVSLPKLKTHRLTRITGAIKNQLGCVYGFHKASFHLKYPDVHEFCKFLVALNLFLKPRLFILDAITAMEGNGPGSGDPISLNTLIISHDPVAVDATACRLVGLDPAYVLTNAIGEKLGLGTMDNIEYLGDPLEPLINRNFNVVRNEMTGDALFHALDPLKNIILPKPVIKNKLCIKCGVCIDACPVPGKALNFPGKDKKKPPKYSYDACIRCFCCQEMCPHGAIYVKTPFIGKLFNR
jgi:uncharacterized protein (DUF362 family)/NAD-dependent dihydropyrimidine dehydrogenase PreA subunit